MHLSRLIVLAALGISACDVSDVSSNRTGTTDVSAEATSVGKFADAKPSDLEARAKAAGWKVVSSDSDDDPPVPSMALELDDGSHFAYVTVFDFAPRPTKMLAAKMGQRAAIAVHIERGEREPPADKLLAGLLRRTPIDGATGESLKTAVEGLGYRVTDSRALEEDGVIFALLSAEGKDDSSIEIAFQDLSAAMNEGRIGIDGHRVMNVFVCKDCTKRNTRILSQAWQTAKAKVLLGRLTKD